MPKKDCIQSEGVEKRERFTPKEQRCRGRMEQTMKDGEL